MAGRTTFVVANRLSLLKRADKIIVLEKGSISMMGTHAELVERDGPYKSAALVQMME